MAKWFSAAEIAGLDPKLVEMLDEARERAGVPFVVVSGKRTVVENANAGGVKNSAHTRGLAVDLRCHDNVSRFKMVAALLGVGFTRIGIYTRHIHADNDSSLPSNVCWIGKSH